MINYKQIINIWQSYSSYSEPQTKSMNWQNRHECPNRYCCFMTVNTCGNAWFLINCQEKTIGSMSRMKKGSVLSKFCQYLLNFFKKLINFLMMRRLLTRVINRVLLSDPFSPAMIIEAEIHNQGRRKMVSVKPRNQLHTVYYTPSSRAAVCVYCYRFCKPQNQSSDLAKLHWKIWELKIFVGFVILFINLLHFQNTYWVTQTPLCNLA